MEQVNKQVEDLSHAKCRALTTCHLWTNVGYVDLLAAKSWGKDVEDSDTYVMM